MLLLLGCWAPDAYTPPPPPPEAVEAMEALAQAPEPEAEPEAAEPEVAEPEATEPEDEPEAPVAPAMEPYKGRVITSPSTIVDDFGKPLVVLNKAMVAVEVRAEESPIRRKVFCADCKPAVEGWIQWSAVVRE